MAKKSKTSASKALRGFWKPKGVVNERHARSFSAWLEKHAGGIDIATFIHSTDHENKHPKAVSALIK
jgi:hypothetical protein